MFSLCRSSHGVLYGPATLWTPPGSSLHLHPPSFKARLSIFRRDWATIVHTVTVEVHILPGPISSSQGRKTIHPLLYSQSLEGMCEEVIKLPSVFPSLISDLSISHGLLLCSSSLLHHSSSFLDLPGTDVQGSAADRQSIWEWDRGMHQGQPWEGRSRRSQEALVLYQFQHMT